MTAKTQKNKKYNFHIPKLKLRYRLLLYFAAILVITLTLLSLVLDFLHPILEIVCYVCAMLLLIVGTYYLVLDILYLKKHVLKGVVSNHPVANRMSSDYRYRTFLFTIPGVLGNILFAVVNAWVGFFGHSAWFGSMAAYYILLSLMRIQALRQAKKLADTSPVFQERETTALSEPLSLRYQKELLVYKRNSILFLFMAIVLGGLVALLLLSEGGKTYPGFTIYAMAAYTFYRITMSILNMIKTYKLHSPLLMIIRKIGYVDSCVSILILQTAMFAAFATDTEELFIKWMNGLTGGCVFFMVAIMGIQGILSAKKWTTEVSYDSHISSR